MHETLDFIVDEKGSIRGRGGGEEVGKERESGAWGEYFQVLVLWNMPKKWLRRSRGRRRRGGGESWRFLGEQEKRENSGGRTPRSRSKDRGRGASAII